MKKPEDINLENSSKEKIKLKKSKNTDLDVGKNIDDIETKLNPHEKNEENNEKIQENHVDSVNKKWWWI